MTSRALVLDDSGVLVEKSFAIVTPDAGFVLARVIMATICGSDLHTIQGKRKEPTPLILGHEILCRVHELGEGVSTAHDGSPLAVGDRITFSVAASCGSCAQCATDLPQKCDRLFKYGHACCSNEPALSGGFAEYIYLRPGSAIFHVPPQLTDRVATPANCALATVVNAVETSGFVAGERAVVLGAGLLGLYAVALLKHRGAAHVAVSDVSDERLALARQFGADTTANVSALSPDETLNALGGDASSDVVIEVCGVASSLAVGVCLLRLRGRLVTAGLVCAGSNFTCDANTITRRYLCLRGIHNYAPAHLATAIKFLADTHSRFPFEQLVPVQFPQSQMRIAIERALGRSDIRVAIALEEQ